jgi:Stress responsive A/B Barrel Domain.
MWRFKRDLEKSPQEIAEWMKAHLEALVGIVPQCLSMEVGINVNKGDAAYDAVLISRFHSKDDLDAYKVHPEHVKISSFCKAARESRVVVDYYTEE